MVAGLKENLTEKAFLNGKTDPHIMASMLMDKSKDKELLDFLQESITKEIGSWDLIMVKELCMTQIIINYYRDCF